MGNFLDFFEDPKDTPPPTRVETKEERLDRKRREKAEQVTYNLEREIALWDPHQVKHATEDPFRTLFVARIVSKSGIMRNNSGNSLFFFFQNYDTSEAKLRREFEMYGPIKKIILTHNTEDGKPRGFAFIEYEHERDMHCKYWTETGR